MRGVDLFCGVGGLSKGLCSSGIDVIASYDFWNVAVETYNCNMKHPAYKMDLTDADSAIQSIRLHKPDIISGGPPCQDYSTAGQRTEGCRANLTVTYARIAAGVKPPLVLMENVPQVRKSTAYRHARKILEEAGYRIFERVLNASYCGVPQSRKRFFMLAWLTSDNVGEKLNDWIENNLAVEPLTVRGYMKSDIDVDFYYRHPRNYSRRAVFSVDEPSPTIRGVNRPVPPGYVQNHLDSASPQSVRPLTIYERSRIQTFPKSWKWDKVKTGKTNVEMMIGNAVPVNLSMFLGKGIFHASV